MLYVTPNSTTIRQHVLNFPRNARPDAVQHSETSISTKVTRHPHPLRLNNNANYYGKEGGIRECTSYLGDPPTVSMALPTQVNTHWLLKEKKEKKLKQTPTFKKNHSHDDTETFSKIKILP